MNDIEFLRLTPDFDPHSFDPFLETGAQLGAKHIVTAPYDPDLARLTDNLAVFSARAADFALKPVLEFFPWTNVPDFRSALKIVTATGDPNIGVLLDSLHFDRSTSTLADVEKADPSRLPFVHLCDALVQPSYTEAELLHTAREARLIPGQGQIRLHDLLSALPANIPTALEIPMKSELSNAILARQMFEAAQAVWGRV